MVFSKMAKALAWLALIVGAIQLVLGFGIAAEALGPYEQALARYAPGASSAGRVIERGFYAILFAIVLGTLAEISFHLRR